MNLVTSLKTVTSNVRSRVEGELERTGGLLRLAPCWVPRSFLQPGKRLKLHPDDLYAYGLNRGGIDERWFASTTPAANDNRTAGRGAQLCRRGRGAVHAAAARWRRRARCSSARRSGANTASGRSTRSSSITWGRSRITCTRAPSRRSWSGRRASRRATTSRRSITTSATTSRTPSWASSPAPPRRRCAAAWRTGTRATTASSISRAPTG